MAQTIQQNSSLNFGDAGSPFGARTAKVLGADGTFVLPRGWYLVETDAHTTFQFSYNKGSNWVTWVPVSDARLIYSDGYNVEALGDGTGGTVHYSQLLGV